MSFIEAMIALLDGKMVRRTYWDTRQHIRIRGNTVVFQTMTGPALLWQIVG